MTTNDAIGVICNEICEEKYACKESGKKCKGIDCAYFIAIRALTTYSDLEYLLENDREIEFV